MANCLVESLLETSLQERLQRKRARELEEAGCVEIMAIIWLL